MERIMIIRTILTEVLYHLTELSLKFIRQEMTTLQERMDEHKKTVQKVVYSQ